jgi:hypothetical protein
VKIRAIRGKEEKLVKTCPELSRRVRAIRGKKEV